MIAKTLATLALCGWLLSLPAHGSPERWRGEWPNTDFTKTTVKFSEIISGGPPRDGIPPIDEPRYVSPASAAKWLEEGEPVLVFERDGDARAYPMQILIWHEIVNATVGGQPVAVTFCPLCGSALVFDRRLDGQVLDFGTTGKLRNSDLVMWDRQTESWWQQLTGEGIVGTHAGRQLTVLPAALVAFSTFRGAYPRGRVLSRETGHSRDYGANPYVRYDSPENTSPFLLKKPADTRLHPVERVVAVELGGESRAYPYRALGRHGLAQDSLGGKDIVVFFQPETRSALDGAAIGSSRRVGSGAVFERTLAGRKLTFAHKAGRVTDGETGSSWNILGQAVAGPLKGRRLTPVVHGNHFAFAWLVFRPKSGIWRGP